MNIIWASQCDFGTYSIHVDSHTQTIEINEKSRHLNLWITVYAHEKND